MIVDSIEVPDDTIGTHSERNETAEILAIWRTLSPQQKKKKLAKIFAVFPDLEKTDPSLHDEKQQVDEKAAKDEERQVDPFPIFSHIEECRDYIRVAIKATERDWEEDPDPVHTLLKLVETKMTDVYGEVDTAFFKLGAGN